MLPDRISCLRRFSAALLVSSAALAFAAPKPGANLPWTTLHATDGATDGERLASTTYGEIASEATRRACVRLDRPGESIVWTVPELPQGPANAIVVRQSIPDAPRGGGRAAALELWINGQLRQRLALDSRHSWLYGTRENAQENDPSAGPAHHFFNDARAFVEGAPIKAGDKVELRLPGRERTTDDSADWVSVDLVDLENVPPPATPPPRFVSIIDHGARPDDGLDDTTAIKAALADAVRQKTGLWFPAGTFLQSEPIALRAAVEIRGAGPWRTRLTATAAPVADDDWRGNVGFRFEDARDVTVADLMIEGTITSRSPRKQHGFTGRAAGFVLENVWIAHVDTGAWLGPCERGIVRRCRVRDTYADGFNVNNGSVSILFEHNHTRNTGDDGFASYAGTDLQGARHPNRDIVFRNNTAETPWWAHGIAIYGGENIRVEDNLVLGTARAPGIIVATTHGAWAGRDILVARNEVADCGGTSWKQTWGALFLYTPKAGLAAINVRDNAFLRPAHDAVKIQGDLAQGAGAVEARLEGNRIEAPRSGSAILIVHNAKGEVELRGNSLLPADSIRNEASAERLALRRSDRVLAAIQP